MRNKTVFKYPKMYVQQGGMHKHKEVHTTEKNPVLKVVDFNKTAEGFFFVFKIFYVSIFYCYNIKKNFP